MEKTALQEFHNFLKSKGFKLTGERKIILEEIFSTHRHINAEELFIGLRKKKANVSRATVYRTLNLLVSSGLVQRISFGEKFSVYEHVFGHAHHDHLICIACGAILEFDDEELQDRYREVSKRESFEALAFRLQIFGYCRNCR